MVKEVGEGVKGYKPGDRVIAFTTYGAFAEEVKVEAGRLVPIPEGMDYNSAAAFLLTYGTSDHALRDRGQLKAGETLLVLGAAGGVGLAAIEIGKAMGATVIACASSADKLEVCRQHGADAGINYATEDMREKIKELTGGKGVDVVYDAVGGPYSEPALRSTAWRGRFLVVGFAAGDIPKIPLNLTAAEGLLDRRRVLGGFRAPRAESIRREHRPAGQMVPRGQAEAPRLADLPARAGGRCAETDGRPESERESRSYGLGTSAYGLVPSPAPSGSCMYTLSTQRPNL